MREWLREMRLSKGFTQQKVADELGVSFQQYSFIENGKRQQDMNLSTASKLADLFGITLTKLRELEESVRKDQPKKVS